MDEDYDISEKYAIDLDEGVDEQWDYRAYSAALYIIFVAVHICFMLFLLFLFWWGNHRRILRYQLAANLTLGHLPAALFLYSGYIRMTFFNEAVAIDYCMFMEYIACTFEVYLPWLLFMFSIERLIYIRDPSTYGQKINRAGAITLVAFPWIFSGLIAVVTIMPFDYHMKNYDELTTMSLQNITDYTCEYNDDTIEVRMRFWVGTDLPFFMSGIIVITTFVMWCLYKRNHALGRDYSLMGENVVEEVRNSVIAVAILNGFGILGTILENVQDEITEEYVDITLNFVEGTLWMTTLPLVRAKLVRLGQMCCCKRKPKTVACDESAAMFDESDELELGQV